MQSLFIKETTGLLVITERSEGYERGEARDEASTKSSHHKIFFGPAYFLNDAEDKNSNKWWKGMVH